MKHAVRRRVGAAIVLPLGLLASLVAVPAQEASAEFTEGVSVSQAGFDSYGQRVAFDRQGRATLVWVRQEQSYPNPRRVQVRSRAADGAWGTVRNVSPAGQDPRNPEVVLDDDGDAVVVWDAFDGPDRRVYARRVSRTGTLGTLSVLSPAGVSVNGTDVAVDADGDAVVTWSESRSDGSAFPMMRQMSSSGSLSPAVELSSRPRSAEVPEVAFDREGDAVLAWADDNVVQARTLSAAGVLGRLEKVSADLSPIDRHFNARVTVDRDGDALVTWRHWTASDGSEQLWGRWMSRAGAVGAVRQLTPSSHPDVSNYSVAGDLDGDVIVVWDRFPTQNTYALLLAGTATIGEPILLTTYGRMNSVSVDDDGDGIVVWQGEGIAGSADSIRARQVTSSGTFGAEQVVASNGRFPVTAVDTEGRGIVSWERRFQVDLRIQASVGP